MNKDYLVHLMIGLLLTLTGCASFTPVQLSVPERSKPVSITANINRDYTLIKHFTEEQKVPFLFLVRLNPEGSNPDLEKMLGPELNSEKADAIVNVKIEGHPAFGDVMLPLAMGIIGGIAFPPLFVLTAIPFFEDLKTYKVEGDLVKYSDPQSTHQPTPQFDPATGLPVISPRFDPETGLPTKN